MKIKINGAVRTIENTTTVQDLLGELKLCAEHVVIEINRNIVTPEQYPHHSLEDNDNLEIVHFVGGG